MKKHVAALVIILSLAFSGGCAVVPALITTGASFAVPQSASMVITAASTIHKTVLFAADERSADDMLADKFLTLQAQALLLADPQVDMDASCYNGDIYLVGDYATPADRDRIVARLSKLNGVSSVKGVVKQQPSGILAMMEPAISDSHAESVIEAGLLKELHIRSANVDVEVIQGEAVVMGVVRDKQEADEVLAIIDKLRPEGTEEIKVTSLLAYQNAHEQGVAQENETYALMTSGQMLAAATPAGTGAPATKPAAPAPEAPYQEIDDNPALDKLYAHYFPDEPSLWQKSRRKMKNRILALAKAETDPKVRKELITLSSRVLKDNFMSIERRLVRTLNNSDHPKVRRHVDRLLDDYAPERTKRIHTLAMN